MANKFFSNWIVKNLIGAVVLVLVLSVVVTIFLNIFTQHGKTIGVPDFTNMSVEEAQQIAADNSIVVYVADSVFVNRMTHGAIYSQNPKPGSLVKDGRRIAVTINAMNSKLVSMPNLVGYSLRQAKAELNSKGLSLGKIKYVEDMATNNVLRQYYKNSEIDPGDRIESGSVIDLVLGLDATERTTLVPDVVGMKYLRAVDAVQDNSLNIGRLVFDDTVETYSDTLSSVVYRQTPAVSDMTVGMGSEVRLYLTNDMSKVSR